MCFQLKYDLKKHIYRQHANKNPLKNLKCTECDKLFEKKEKLEAHLNRIHLKEACFTFRSETFRQRDISVRTFRSQNISVTDLFGQGTFRSRNFSVREHFGHGTFRSQNISVTELFGHRTFRSQNISVRVHFSQRTFQSRYISVTVFFG